MRWTWDDDRNMVIGIDCRGARIKLNLRLANNVTFVPEGELPLPIKSNGLFGELKGVEIPLSDFNKLTKIPIVIYYGDNIADKPTEVWNKDHWRSGLEMARLWAATINRHGGDATVIHLPEIGIKGNTHFPFSDLNNIEVADELSKWLKQKGLDK